jgi:hypothetical protein
VSSAPLRRNDDCEPLDLDRTIAYRFGNLSHLTRRPHLSVCFKTNPARAKRFLGRPVRVLFRLSPLGEKSVRFVFLYSPAFSN